MYMVAPHPHRGFPASVQSAPAKCLHFVKFGLLVCLNIKGYQLFGSKWKVKHMISRTTFNHIEIFVVQQIDQRVHNE